MLTFWYRHHYIVSLSALQHTSGSTLSQTYAQNLSCEGSLSGPSELPWGRGGGGRANVSHISLQKCLHEKQKFGSAKRVTRLAGSLFFDSLVTLLAGPTILHVTVGLSQPDQLGSKADTPEGFCFRSTLQALFERVSTHEGAFSSSFNLPREHFAGWKFCSQG